MGANGPFHFWGGSDSGGHWMSFTASWGSACWTTNTSWEKACSREKSWPIPSQSHPNTKCNRQTKPFNRFPQTVMHSGWASHRNRAGPEKQPTNQTLAPHTSSFQVLVCAFFMRMWVCVRAQQVVGCVWCHIHSVMSTTPDLRRQRQYRDVALPRGGSLQGGVQCLASAEVLDA